MWSTLRAGETLPPLPPPTSCQCFCCNCACACACAHMQCAQKLLFCGYSRVPAMICSTLQLSDLDSSPFGSETIMMEHQLGEIVWLFNFYFNLAQAIRGKLLFNCLLVSPILKLSVSTMEQSLNRYLITKPIQIKI